MLISVSILSFVKETGLHFLCFEYLTGSDSSVAKTSSHLPADNTMTKPGDRIFSLTISLPIFTFGRSTELLLASRKQLFFFPLNLFLEIGGQLLDDHVTHLLYAGSVAPSSQSLRMLSTLVFDSLFFLCPKIILSIYSHGQGR